MMNGLKKIDNMEDIVITITIPESEYKNWNGDKETIKKELLLKRRNVRNATLIEKAEEEDGYFDAQD